MNAHITKYNYHRPLTEQEIWDVAPSVFARVAHGSRSDRFAPVPTIDIVRGLAKEGFMPFSAGQSVSRDVSKQPFTKHMVRFRKTDDAGLRVDDNLLELVLVNGNDGSAAYRLEAGIFRIACLNGLIAKSADYGSVRIRHTGEALADVIDASYEVLEGSKKVLDVIEDWRQIKMSDRARHAFAMGAHVERFGDDESRIQPEQLLIPRRPADIGKDLWTTLNVIQENTVEGGIVSPRRRGHHDRRHTTRPINGIDQNVRLNKALWVMAEYMADRSDIAA